MTPLEGTFVLDLTRNLPGPYCGMLLADMGAQVIKVESPRELDPVRVLPPFAEQDGERVSVAFRSINAGKRSVAIDLKASEGRALFLDLVAKADVLLEGFRPGTLERLGIGEQTCRERNPRLVWASLSGFGSEGPYRDRAGHDLTYQALSGALSGGRDANGTSVVPGVQAADMSGALACFAAISVALVARERTGQGQKVDASLFETSLALQPFLLVPGARGERSLGAETLSGVVPCYRVYRSKDGRSVAVAALEPKFWSVFCEIVDKPEWESRGHDSSLEPEVAALIASRTFDEWRMLESAECCVAGVLDPGEVARDPQVEALAAIVNAPDGRAARLRPPFRVSNQPAPSTRAATRVGEHTAEVLKERLGLTEDQFNSLKQRGVVA